MIKIIKIAPLFLALVGCATGYHPSGLSGGFSELQLAENVYVVKFNGNGFTSMYRATQFALRRSAELTKERGYRYFNIVDSSANVNRSYHRTPVTANTTSNSSGSVYGSYGYGRYNGFGNSTTNTTTTFSGGDVYAIERPETYITIKLYKTKNDGSLDADIILSNFKN
ncbi:hypothetical protein OQJ19_12635 [Fluoribacter gormanii]|uniref:CC0125/CC1285 family lipoprotein n=1 Tax=Fluoribacter gormanii TaxID=464 RepID=UPI0022440806|nr:hypothetical protein [Fluoribacter gormanii]MCW8471486.1 hypothetical protein [Fluoribacter gormanii]